MKPQIKIYKWIKLRFKEAKSPKYSTLFVEEWESVIPSKKILVVQDGRYPDTLVFKCPCGCNQDIYLNLLKDSRPCWDFYVSKRKKITISPSVWRKVGCRSHFFIRNGKVKWV